jgi:FAD/FMN-containing dehydrogenase
MVVSNAIKKQDLQSLQQIVGNDNVSTDAAKRELFSQDIWSKGDLADFVISPENTEQLAQAIKVAARSNIVLNPRGGGMSYTNGYTPTQPNTGILDFTKMDKILEINEDDMYITVQAGCTWVDIYNALKPLGLRTPFWGPLSGLRSTIGGGLSQNNAFWGSGTYGTSVDSVTSLTVVIADGTIVKTGSGGTKNGKPFWRQYGPDLTGLFLSDAGALGYKAEATLRLIPYPPAEDWASFEFDTRDDWAIAMEKMGKTGLACELFGFDPNLSNNRLARDSLASDVTKLKNVVTGQKGILKGIKEGAKVALAGRGYMDEVVYSMHAVVEGHSDAEVAAKMKTLVDIAKQRGGNSIENSIPKIIRANPFGPLNTILGPHGERWAPIHAVVPMSEGKNLLKALDDLFEDLKPELDKYEIGTGYLTTTLSTNGYLVEPVLIWPEELFDIHRDTVEPSHLKRVKTFGKNPEATEMVTQVRHRILDTFAKHNAIHFQIGRTYRFKETREENTWALLEKIKAAVDPKNLVNPGSLGLE